MIDIDRTSALLVDSDFRELIQGRDWMEWPELRLLVAIIERAVRDAAGNNKAEAQAATDWLFCDELEDPGEFTLPWMCELLELDRGELLSKVRYVMRHGIASGARNHDDNAASTSLLRNAA